jgi:hypothetical protein
VTKRGAHRLTDHAVESTIFRKLSTWLLVAYFGAANLPPTFSGRKVGGPVSCCAQGPCCQMGHCAMDATSGPVNSDAHRIPVLQATCDDLTRCPSAGMPANCPMDKPSEDRHSSVSCTCSVSRAPSIGLPIVHTYLLFDPCSHSAVIGLPTTSRFVIAGISSPSDGFPQKAAHPPRLSS